MTRVKNVGFDPSNQSAFGTLETGHLEPVIQGDFVFGLNTQVWQLPVASGTGASVDTDGSRLRIQSGTGSANYAYILSKRPVKYRAGQGTTGRFTPLFSAGVANNLQFWGVAGISANAIYDGYGFAYNGADFGIAHYVRGALNWHPQSAWNGDKANGSAGSSFTYNPLFGVPAQIKYPYLGYGNILFFLQNPVSGAWRLVHTIRYANTSAATQLSNPTMYFVGYAANSGNTTNKTMYCGSFGFFISGKRSFVGNPKRAVDSTKSSITTETNLLTIKNATTYNGVSNRALVRVKSLSFGSSAASGTANLRIKLNAALGGTPSYTPLSGSTADNGATITSGNSCASADVAGTTVTGGDYVFGVSVDNPSSTGLLDLTEEDIILAPGDTLTISGEATANSTMAVTANLSDDI